MKRRIALSIGLALSVLVSLMILPARTEGSHFRGRHRADTGVFTPGVGQILRVTVAPTGNDPIRVRFRGMQYMPAGCNTDGVCRQISRELDRTTPVLLSTDEAASIDFPGDGNGVRVVVESDSQTAKVIFQIIDMATGESLGGGNEVLWQ